MMMDERYYSEKKISSSKNMRTFQNAMGIAMMILGGLGLFSYVGDSSDFNWVDLLLYLVIAIGGVVLFVFGKKRKKLIDNFLNYVQYLEVQDTIEISELSIRMGRSEEIILQELGALLEKQYFNNMIIDYATNQIKMFSKNEEEKIHVETEIAIKEEASVELDSDNVKQEVVSLCELKENSPTIEDLGISETDAIKELKENQEKSKSEATKKIGKFFSEYNNFKELNVFNKILHVAVPVLCLFLLLNIFGGGKGSKQDYIDCAKTVVSQQLRSPSTAMYYGEEILDEDKYGRVLVRLCVEAQNGFGGYVKNTFLLVITDYNDRTEEFIHGNAISYDVSEEWLEDGFIEQAKSAANWGEPLSEDEKL